MGLKSIEKMKPTYEVPPAVLELVRTSVLEDFQQDFYHNPDDHVKSTIELHKKIAKKYPNFYADIFSDKEFTDYFLDTAKVISLPYLLQDKSNIDVAFKQAISTQINRIDVLYELCRNEELFGVVVKRRWLQKLLYAQLHHIANEKPEGYVGMIAVKYARNLEDIIAPLHLRKQKLPPVWQEALHWIFGKDENYDYVLPVLREAARLRKLVKEKKKLDFIPKHIPFENWKGYAAHLGLTQEEIFKKGYKLMTNNETRRYLSTLQKYGLLESTYHKKKIEKKLEKTHTDLVQLFYSLKVLDDKAKEMMMKKGKQEFDNTVSNLKKILEDKIVNVAIDCSGGCAGFTNLLSPEMQKKIINGEKVPRWAKIVQRETFNVNVLIGKVLSTTSKKSKIYLFNEAVQETELPEKFEDLVEELKTAQCGGGSNILEAVNKAIESNPDIAFVVTDMNENIPFQGALKMQIEKISKKFSGILVFIITEVVVERPEATLLDDIIRDKELHNVYLIPVKQMKQIEKGFVLIKLIDKAKKLFVTVTKKKKKKEGDK